MHSVWRVDSVAVVGMDTIPAHGSSRAQLHNWTGQQLPASPSPRPWKPPCYSVSVSLAFQNPHVSGKRYVSFSIWLIPLKTVSSRCINIVAHDRTSFTFKGWLIFHCMQEHIFSVHSSFDKHLGCFCIVTYEYHSVSTGVHISLQDLDFNSFDLISRSGIAGLFGSFLRTSIIVFHSWYIIFYSYQHCTKVPTSPHPCYLFKITFMLIGVKIFHCGFDLLFPDV